MAHAADQVVVDAPIVKFITAKLAALVKMNITQFLSRLRHTANISASSASLVAIVECMANPTRVRVFKSIATVKYNQPS